jgi:hypothetical protein
MTNNQTRARLRSPGLSSSLSLASVRQPCIGSVLHPCKILLRLTPLSVQGRYPPIHISSYHQSSRSRFLTEDADVWSQNAWDHVPPPADQDATVAASLARQRAAPVSDDDKLMYNMKPAKHWSTLPVPSYPPLTEPVSIGTTSTRQTPQTSSKTASGAFSPFTITLSKMRPLNPRSGYTSSFRSSSQLPIYRCASFSFIIKWNPLLRIGRMSYRCRSWLW